MTLLFETLSFFCPHPSSKRQGTIHTQSTHSNSYHESHTRSRTNSIDCALLHSIPTAAQLFHLHVSMIYRWIPRRDEMMRILSDCKLTERRRRMGRPGRRVEYPEEEQILDAWINDQRLQGVPVVYPHPISTSVERIQKVCVIGMMDD